MDMERDTLQMQDKNLEKILSKLELNAKLQQKKNGVRKDLKEKGKLKNGELNEYDNYQYFSEAQHKELFTDLLSKHGIELCIDEISYEEFVGTDKQPFGRRVTLAFTLIDIETGYSETSRHTGEGLDRGDKAGYKATTGALKRFLSSTFLVATQDDPEREDDTSKTKKASAPINRNIKKGTITVGQLKMLKSLYSNNVEELKNILKGYNKKKIEELNVEEASKIIDMKKEKKENE